MEFTRGQKVWTPEQGWAKFERTLVHEADASYVTKGSKMWKVRTSTISLAVALRAGYSTDKVEAFRNGLLSGTGLETRDARRYVREFLITRQKGRTVRYQEQIAYMKWAFDKFYTKTPVSALRKTSLVTF